MKKVDSLQENRDPTIFNVFPRVLPVEIVMQHGGDHPKTKEVVVTPPPLRNTRSTLSSLSSLSIWQEEYKS